MTQAADPRATWRALLASGHFGEYVLLCSGILLHASDTLVTATLMPAAVAQIGGVAYINWTIALYQIGSIIMGATGGTLARRHGLRALFVAGAVVYALGCFIAALSPHMAAMLVGRLVQGLGGGLMLSLSYLAVQLLFPRTLWPKVYALSAAIWSLACLSGPLIGGLFADAGLWRGAFWVFGLPALALSLAAARYLRTAQPAIDDGSSISWPALAWLTSAVLAIAEAGALAQLRYSLPLGCAGAAMLALAAIADRGASQHLFPRQLTELRTAVGQGLLMVAALSAGTTAFWAYGPLVLKVAFSIDPLVPGILMAVESLLWSVATIVVTTMHGDETVCIRSGVAIAALGAAGLAVAMPLGSLAGIGVCL
ncbi:MAG: MFS transporter, partial [Pseudomonadota bacterium]|nr:MFS transporter [Pseudomonadota bacterium]